MAIFSDNQMTLSEVLELLATRKKQYPDQFPAGALEAEVQAANNRLPIPLPLAWQEVLKVSDGFNYSNNGYDCYFYGTKNILTTDTDERDMLRDLMPPQILLADDGSGDSFTLDVSRQTQDGQCPIMVIAHEDENSEWETVADFLAWLLQDEDK